MPVAFKASLGSGVATSSGTTITITTTANIDVDDLVVVRAAADNLNATTPTFTCADGGNTYTTTVQLARNATAAAGVAGAVMCTKATTAKPAGSTITVILSGAVAHKAAYAESFSGVLNTTRSTPGSLSGASTIAASPASGTVAVGDLVIGAVAYETRGNLTGDADTGGGTWSTLVQARSATSGSDATCVSAAGQYKIPNTITAQTLNISGVSADWVAFVVVLQATPEPSITQAAYQWFEEGTESGAVPYVAQDTAVTGDITNGDATGTLRVRLQSTTAIAVPATDDWQLQYEKNVSGTWVNITPSSLAVQTYDSPNLTGTGATTNRLTGGTGGFTAGEVSEDGTANDKGWPGNGFTEFVYALKVIAADLADGDTVRFRVLRNGATATMTYTITPTINLIKSVVPPNEGSATVTHDWAPTAVGQTPLFVPEGSAIVTHDWSGGGGGAGGPVATPTVRGNGFLETFGTASQTDTSSSFTPAANALLVCIATINTQKNTAVGSSMSSTGLGAGAFTKRVTIGPGAMLAGGSGYYNTTEIWVGQAGASPGAGTFSHVWTAPSSNTVRSWVFLEIPSGFDPAVLVADGATGTVAGTQNPTVTMSGTPAGTSMVLSTCATWDAGASAPITVPTSFTQLIDQIWTGWDSRSKLGYRNDGTNTATHQWSAPNGGNGIVAALEIEVVTVSGGATGKRVPKASATVTYTQTLTAAGKATPKATATTTYVETTTAVGKQTPKATATTTHSWVTTAAGVKPAVGVKQGTAAVAWTETTTSAGKQAPKGATTAAHAWTLTAAGKKTQKSTVTTSWTEATAAAGKRTPKSGVITTDTWVTPATGTRTPEASAIIAHTWALGAAGSAPAVGVKQGFAAVSYTWAPAATGKRVPKGGNTIVVTWALTAAGRKVQRGVATTSYTETPSAAGKRVPKGSSTVTWTEAITAAGKRASKATASTTHSWTLFAQGVAPIVGVKQGTALVSHQWTPTAAGRRVTRGSSAVVVTWTPSATGRRVQQGTATIAHLWLSDATGRRSSQAVGVVLHAWASIASGERFPQAGAAFTVMYLLDAEGIAGIGYVTGLYNGQRVTAMMWGPKEVVGVELING